MYVTTYLSIPKGHEDIDFVDITTDADTELFIDPCLIERGRDPLSREAAEIIADFADRCTLTCGLHAGTTPQCLMRRMK